MLANRTSKSIKHFSPSVMPYHFSLGLDWTSLGEQLGLAGKSAKANMVFVQERKVKQETVVLIECTMYVKEDEAVIDQLSQLYAWQVVVLGPDDFGVPNYRGRKFMIGVLRSFGGMKHPVTDNVYGVPRYYKALCLTGDDLFIAPEDEIKAYQMELAKSRGVPSELAAYGRLEDVLAAGGIVRLENYNRKLDKMLEAQC
jgi:hypothetical protein